MRTQFVIKMSKLCNLRCSYCYEYAELGNPVRMSLDQLGRMFRHLADYYREHADNAEVVFIWHGGEPLVQEPQYYSDVFAEQRRHFHDVKAINWVQTNLTLLDEQRLDLLKNQFNSIGVSIDVFGDLRLNIAGKSSQTKVLENMARLQEAGVPHGCITVLTQRNIPYLDRIFKFYEMLGRSFRVLPLFRGATGDQHLGYEVGGREVLSALCHLADLWLASETSIEITPITTQLRALVRSKSRTFEPEYYDRRAWESVILVNTNGDLYSQADAYEPGRAWGNIFETPFGEILRSDTHERSVHEAEARMAATCLDCSYFGTCRGYPIAEDNRGYADANHGGRIACIVEQGLFQHLDRRLRAAETQLGSRFWERIEGVASKPAEAEAQI